MRRALVVLAVAVVAFGGVTVPAGPALAQAALTRMPLDHLPTGTRQVIIVHAATAATTYAVVETFQKAAGWHRAYPPMHARIGARGFSDHHVEGTPNTPTGMYPIGPTMYGIDADPGVRYPYHRLVSGDWWNENPQSSAYNTFHHGTGPGGASEALWRTYPAYRWFAEVRYNVPAVPGRGSAIFLHADTGGPTEGCVSLGADDLRSVLTWLDPAAQPRIVLAPDTALGRY